MMSIQKKPIGVGCPCRGAGLLLKDKPTDGSHVASVFLRLFLFFFRSPSSRRRRPPKKRHKRPTCAEAASLFRSRQEMKKYLFFSDRF
ncbi:hypothetical protein [Pandoravirus japonicus]|uniref:Uncharacterized protein n=1 Tax=Pandoravirus japonicus TaxID=2823154 RepID=A0A811BP04_9VIRU|nr:hypothetical protein [Pandoravirus japonicus]